jgi:hypothetical protein
MEFVDQAFKGVTVELDGNRYIRCTFVDVIFHYAGGPLDMEGCGMDRFSFQFDGDLARGLFTLYQLFGTDGMLRILRSFTDPKPGETVIQLD